MITSFDFLVAKRYLLPKTSDSFFSIITIFSFLGISLGVATLIIVMSVMNGFREELTNKVLGINGHMKIKPYNNLYINNYKNLIDSIESKDSNIETHPTLSTQVLLSFKNNSSGVLIKGISYENLVDRKLLKQGISKESLQKFKRKEGIIIGERLREKFRISQNEYVKVISPNAFETPLGKLIRSSNYEIIGSFETGMYEYDLSIIIMPLSLLQNFLDINDKVDTIELFVENFKEIDNDYLKVKSILPDYFNLIDWRNLNPSLFNAIKVERNVMFLILLLIIIVAAFNLLSSMIMLVNNKRKDIGILRTLGATKNQLIKIFVINGFAIGFIGTFLGFILGMLFCLNINEIKTFIEIFTESQLFSEEIYFFSNLPVIIDLKEIIMIILISLSLSLLATIYPSIKASNIEPINLIKWE